MRRASGLIFITVSGCLERGSRTGSDDDTLPGADSDTDTDSDSDIDTDTDTDSPDDTGGMPAGVTLTQDVADVLVHVERSTDGPIVVELAYLDGTLLTFPGEVSGGLFEVRLNATCDEVASGELALNVNVDDGGWQPMILAFAGSYTLHEPTFDAYGYAVWPVVPLAPSGPSIVCQGQSLRRVEVNLTARETLTFWSQIADTKVYVIDRGANPWYDHNYLTIEGRRPAGEIASVTLDAGEYDVLVGADQYSRDTMLWGVWP